MKTKKELQEQKRDIEEYMNFEKELEERYETKWRDIKATRSKINHYSEYDEQGESEEFFRMRQSMKIIKEHEYKLLKVEVEILKKEVEELKKIYKLK